MTTTDTNLQNLIINDIPQSDYESITPNANELYLTDEVIESSDVITALGYTPYNASNPAGYTTNVGTVTSVNGIQPVNGNVALTMPTIDQTFDGTSANAQSGVAINGAGFLKNTATGTNSLTLLGNTSTNQGSINIGTNSTSLGNWNVTLGVGAYGGVMEAVAIGHSANYSSNRPGGGNHSVAIGSNSRASAGYSTAIGYMAIADNSYAIQLGYGTNNTASTLAIGFNGTNYQLLDGTTGKIPYQRINSITDSNSGASVSTWTGTRAQYDAIVTKDSNTLYNITDDTDVTLSLLELLYPVGSIYIGTMATCPLATLGVGTWQLVATDRVLQGAGTNTVGSTVEAGLPNIEGSLSSTRRQAISQTHTTGCIYNIEGTGAGAGYDNSIVSSNFGIDASLSSSIYGNSDTVQPPAYIVNIWERIS